MTNGEASRLTDRMAAMAKRIDELEDQLKTRATSTVTATNEGVPTKLEDQANITKSLETALAKGRAMVAIFFIDENPETIGQNVIRLHRHTHYFPRGDFDECVRMLGEDLKNDSGPPIVHTPMEHATVQPQTIELFGEKAGDAQS